MRKIYTVVLFMMTVMVLQCSVLAAENENALEEKWIEIPNPWMNFDDTNTAEVSDTGALEEATLQAIKEKIWSAAQNWTPGGTVKVDVASYHLLVSDLSGKVWNILYEKPRLSYVCGVNFWHLDGVVTEIEFTFSDAYAKADVEAYDAKVSEILSGIQDGWSDFEKVLYLNDYLASHSQYDMNAATVGSKVDPRAYTAYGIFLDKTGVCQGYTMAYRELLNQLNVPNGTATSNTMNHIWNLVQLDGAWYHIDTTWNDPINSAMQNDATAPDLLGYARHSYFLCSDEAFEKHYDWVSYPAGISCTSTIYDDWYGNDVTSPFICLNDAWYYIGKDGLYQTENVGGSNGALAYEITDTWSVWNNSHSYWTGNYSALAQWRGKLIYNTPTAICSYDPITKKATEVFRPDTTNGYLYGFTLEGNTAAYLLAQDPNLTVWVVSETTLKPYIKATKGCYSYYKEDGIFHLRLDQTGILMLVQYDERGRMLETQMVAQVGGELSVQLTNDRTQWKIFNLQSDWMAYCEAASPDVA